MKISESVERTPLLIEQLIVIWEKSVKATHLFLSKKEIKEIKRYVPQALKEIAHLIIMRNEKGCPVAFMG